MKNKIIYRDLKIWDIVFWTAMVVLLGICVFFMIHNAWWIIGDEAIVVSHTGMGKPFLPTGLPNSVSAFGRLYPFAYNLYDVLLLFNDNYITPQAHYTLQSIALVLYALFFAFIGLYILKDKHIGWKCCLTFCFVTITVFRVYMEFTTCYTGAWIIFMFLPMFLYCTIKFEDTERWGYAICGLLIINYINYCYENICVIPLALGVTYLIINYKKISRSKKIFYYLLIASGLLFLLLYAVIVLPKATGFYSHDSEDSILINAIKMFVAHKILWIALLLFIVRCVQIARDKNNYGFFDSLLLTAFAYFIGTAMLKLNFTYYYNFSDLMALVAILYYGKELLGTRWLCVLLVGLTLFYGRKMPSLIENNQSDRLSSRNQITKIAELSKTTPLYWYAPYFEDQSNQYADLRHCQQKRLETIIEWCLQSNEIKLIKQDSFDATMEGVWLFPDENIKLFPDFELPKECDYKIFDNRGIKGYLVTKKR